MSKDVRSEILRQHQELRGLLPRVETLAEQFERSEGEAPDLARELREAGLALYEKFGEHLDSEQELLEPALQRAGERGQRLLRRLEHEHREQRELLGYLLSRLRERPEPTILLSRQLHNFANYLRLEMEHEEKTLLVPELLGDQA